MTAEMRERCVEIFARVTYERVRQEYSTIETRAPWHDLDAEHRQWWLGQEEPYVDALIAAGIPLGEPVAYAVFSSHTFFVPPKIRDVHLRLTRQEADEALEMLQHQADANPQWSCGAQYLIGGLHPLPRIDP